MKKVLFVATVTSHINGFHIPYLKWFKEQEYETHVASRGNEKIQYCDKHFEIPFARFPFTKNNIKAYKELKKVIKENDYQIIHCHTPVGGVLTRLAARKARKKGTKVIYTAHGFHFYKGAPILNWIIYYPIEKIMSRYTDCLITINNEDYERAKKKFKANKIVYVHGVGVKEEKFNFEMSKEEQLKLKSELGINENDFVIIYPAELSKRKNQGMLLQAMQKLKDKGYRNIKLLLPGNDSLNGEYQQMAKDLNISEQVKFLGYRRDIPKLIKISNLAVSTSKQEGLPVNIIEAMMSGIPIIVTNCRGNRDLVDNCVEIGDVEGLYKKIKDIITGKSIESRYKVDDYKLENVLQEMEEIYNSEK